MQQQPTLVTERLILRPLVATDVPVVQRLSRSRKLAHTLHWVFLPHSEKQARRWIDSTTGHFAQGTSAEFGIQLKYGGKLVGLIGIDHINPHDSVADVWFLIVPTCWGKGYATEAARAVLQFGFHGLGLNRIFAYHLVWNLASGRVLAKVGMKPEGVLRQGVRKGERFEDIALVALLREEWDQLGAGRDQNHGGSVPNISAAV